MLYQVDLLVLLRVFDICAIRNFVVTGRGRAPRSERGNGLWLHGMDGWTLQFPISRSVLRRSIVPYGSYLQ